MNAKENARRGNDTTSAREFQSRNTRNQYITRRRKSQHLILARIFGALTALLLVLLICSHTNAAGKPKRELEPVAVRIEAGDTAWAIARRYCPDNMDIRDYLQIVEKKNGVDFGKQKIHPGEIIFFLEEVSD